MIARKIPKSPSAWLITSEDANGESTVVAVENYRRSAQTILRLVQSLHRVVMGYDEAEKLAYARQARADPYPAQMDRYQKITCGHNPYLYARLVTDLRVVDGRLAWSEPPRNTEIQAMVDEREAARRRTDSDRS